MQRACSCFGVYGHRIRELMANVQQSSTNPPRAGYKCSFVRPPPQGLVTQCKVCLCVLREPYVIVCCKELKEVCHGCVESLKNEGQISCHFCSKTLQPFPDKELETVLGDMLVFCSRKNAGCTWEGKLTELDNHQSDCTFQKTQCPHCGHIFYRPSFKSHEETCPSKVLLCLFCKIHRDTAANLDHEHYKKCLMVPVFCPRGCGAKPLRKNMAKHLEKRCPSTGVREGAGSSSFTTPYQNTTGKVLRITDKQDKMILKEQGSIKYLRVTNLAPGTNALMLKCLFTRYGQVKHVQLNESLGLAVIAYERECSAKCALTSSKERGINLLSNQLYLDPVY